MRKYGKYILVVVGVLCMLVFVGNFGSGQGGGSMGHVEMGRMGGKKVTASMIDAEDSLFKVLERLGLTAGLSQRLSENHRAVHWYLLTQEAKQNGIIGTREEITAKIEELKGQAEMIRNRPEYRNIAAAQDFVKTMDELGARPSLLQQAIGDFFAVSKLISAAWNSVPVSLPQIEHLASNTRTKVQVSYVKANAGKSLLAVPEPTEEEIKKQFELYKGVTVEAGKEPAVVDGHRFPFGYKWPDRVQVEFMKFDRAAIRANVKPTAEDVVAALREYEANPMAFPNDAPDAVGPTTAPKAPFKSFEEVKARLVEKQVDARVTQIMKKMVARAQGLSNEPWRAAKIDDKGYREAVPAESWKSYEAIAKDIQGQRDFAGYLPTVTAPGRWLAEASLQNLAGIGNAAFETQQGWVRFSELASSVRELKGDGHGLARMHLQVGVDNVVRQLPQLGAEGDVYMYRVVKAEKSHEPASLEEVRAAVVDDLKKLARFKKLEAEANEIAQAGQTQELSVAAVGKGFLPGETEPFSRLSESFARREDLGALAPTVVPGLQSVSGVVDAAFGLVGKKAATTQAGKWAPTTTVSSESSLEVVVLKLMKYEPCPINVFEEGRAEFQQMALANRRQDFLIAWISLDAMAARLGYVPDGGKFE